MRSVGEDEENMVLMQKASTTTMMMMMMMMGCGGGGAREGGKDHPRAYVKITTNKQNNVSRHEFTVLGPPFTPSHITPPLF